MQKRGKKTKNKQQDEKKFWLMGKRSGNVA